MEKTNNMHMVLFGKRKKYTLKMCLNNNIKY